jgi:hypothetical protein
VQGKHLSKWNIWLGTQLTCVQGTYILAGMTMQAEFGSSGAASLGGKARAEAMTEEDRKESARRAAEARWAKAGKAPIPRATHTGDLTIGDITIPCCVLDDGTRLLTQRGFQEAMGKHPKANVRGGEEEQTPPILQGKTLKPFVDLDLLEKSKPVVFITPNGQRASGYRADLIPRICEVFLRAKDNGALRHNLMHVAKRAELLIRGLAHVGIIALVDEATGFQDVRSRDALAKILEAFIAKELRAWVKTFPPDFYKEMFRLRGWAYNGTVRAPRFAGKLTNDLIYRRLAPGVLAELRQKNPANDVGQRRFKHHQWLTADIGHPKLLQHLASVTTLMKACDDWPSFEKMVDRALPRQPEIPLFEQANLAAS